MTDLELLRIQLRATQRALEECTKRERVLMDRLERQGNRLLDLMFRNKRKGRGR